MADLSALPRRTVEREGLRRARRHGHVRGPAVHLEMPELTSVIPFSEAEQELLTGWQDPPAWDAASGREVDPPGRGKFLVKVGTGRASPSRFG